MRARAAALRCAGAVRDLGLHQVGGGRLPKPLKGGGRCRVPGFHPGEARGSRGQQGRGSPGRLRQASSSACARQWARAAAVHVLAAALAAAPLATITPRRPTRPPFHPGRRWSYCCAAGARWTRSGTWPAAASSTTITWHSTGRCSTARRQAVAARRRSARSRRSRRRHPSRWRCLSLWCARWRAGRCGATAEEPARPPAAARPCLLAWPHAPGPCVRSRRLPDARASPVLWGCPGAGGSPGLPAVGASWKARRR